MNSQPKITLSSANMVNQPFSNPQRVKKVRSSLRKRGSRGKGKGRKEKNAVEAVANQQQDTSQPDVTMEIPKPKRRRERKNRKWKPYSAMTWQEKLEQEKKESIKAEQMDNPFDAPSSRRKKRKKNTEINMPRAPRNTTQSLIHADSTEYERASLDLERRVVIPSMQGILSRETLKNGRNFDSHEDSSDDDSEGGVRSPGSISLGSPYDGSINGDQVTLHSEEIKKRDRRISELIAENEQLRTRIEELERKANATTNA